MNNTDFIFETSWEVCNKVGGIHTVLMTKASSVHNIIGDNYILIGPDLVQNNKEHSEFIQDDSLLKTWKTYALQQGLKIRTGRWNINCKPIVILVDFTQYFPQKDEIFAEFWEKYGVDSLTGGWDYIEPFLFGYAAAKVIECYYNFYLDATDKAVAHFHEWMTGSGILYLKSSVPQIATVFTTHATVLGRCLAGNAVPLYGGIHNFIANKVAKDFNVVSKHSLEKLSAINADGFSTVSGITDKECKQFFGKSADVITPNGFEGDFVPNENEYNQVRNKARNKIFEIIKQANGCDVPQDAFLIINSGRYEFKNKGIDIFIQAMAQLNKSQSLNKKIIAVIAVPAGNMGIKQELFTTHCLTNPDNDPILNAIKQYGITNDAADKVNIMFIPSYLDGNDGVIDMPYFDFMTAFDLSIFPSYYEPWGYTPMESMAEGIPSVTTSLAGFGLWVKDNMENKHNALTIIQRDDNNTQECINQIVRRCEEIIAYNDDQKQILKNDSVEIFKNVQWSELIKFYLQLYNLASDKSSARYNMYAHKKPINLTSGIITSWGEKPMWKKFLVKPSLPEKLQPLNKLAQNLWWSWYNDAFDLFCQVDEEKFFKFDRSPVRLLQSLTKQDYDRLLDDSKFMSQMEKVSTEFDNYIAARKKKDTGTIAYFSMEFGIHDTLQIFSGGLGMLAGDYLKQASDSNKNIIGIGLLYRQGYFRQHITKEGNQQSERISQKFSLLPLQAERDKNGDWKKIVINLPGRCVYAKIWRCDVGAVPLYLLDTDTEENSQEDRGITHQLYGGNNEMRLKQEILLGIGGIRLLQQMNINAELYHSNEGHSAFSSLERLNNYINNDKLSYGQALELVRSSTLFTTHTPVAAGHDMFEEDLMRVYFAGYSQNLNLSWDEFMLLGRKSNDDRNDKFSLSVLAINCSNNINGVSKIHGRVSREMFKYLYDGYFAKEINIGYVTNGVHRPTWAAKQWLDIYRQYFTSAYEADESNNAYYAHIYDVPDEIIWQTHQTLKHDLTEFVKKRCQEELRNRGENPDLYVKTVNALNDEVLTVGFARRFATYKRANLLFTDLNRLESIVNKGVRFIFAGKAHPADIQGQDLIKNIINISKMPQFAGKIIFIENYDMYVAKHLIRGVDLWLNTPTRPLEASGTSGEKAVMNGVINFSVLDGWWAEGFKEDAGWALSETQTYSDNNLQNILDAQMIYSAFENEIIPAYYSKNDGGIPTQWVKMIKNTIAKIAPEFTMKRQTDDYFDKYYNPMFRRTKMMKEDNFAAAKEFALWKQKIRLWWDRMELISIQVPDTSQKTFSMDERFKAKIVLNTGAIQPENIGIEMIITHKENDAIESYDRIEQFEYIGGKNQRAEYAIDIPVISNGVHDYAFRIYPKHDLMNSRMDLPLVKWI